VRDSIDYIVASPIITLTTDFGRADHYVGVMKGVIASIEPAVRTVDICHEIRPYCVAEGAFRIAQSYRFFPSGTVHLVVVDPGVGSARRPIAALAAGHYFVVPDNGVLSQVFEKEASVVREIDVERYGLKPLSHTFHGRDIFAPASAWLARGTSFDEIGALVADPVTLAATAPVEVEPGRWRGRILNVDRFGNLVTSFESNRLAGRTGGFRLEVGRLQVVRRAESYALSSGEEPFLIEGSSGYLEVSINRHSAAARAGARIGHPAELWESVDSSETGSGNSPPGTQRLGRRY
jgi:S-adenosyl-L-methionine hydrolase (adenosine-forming)